MSFKNIFIIFFLFSCSNILMANDNESMTKAVIKTAIYCDHCKVCETCGLKFKTELGKIKGLKKYTIDDKNMTITVNYNNQKTNISTIRTAISKMGYDADNIKADTKAYEQLDGCCKK